MSGTHRALLELYIASQGSLWNVRIHPKPLVASTLPPAALGAPSRQEGGGAGAKCRFGLNGSALLPLATRGQLASFPVSSGAGQEDPLEKEMATHSNTLAWKIPWTEKPGRLQSMGSQRVGQDWRTSLHFILYYKQIDFHLPWCGSLHAPNSKLLLILYAE